MPNQCTLGHHGLNWFRPRLHDENDINRVINDEINYFYPLFWDANRICIKQCFAKFILPILMQRRERDLNEIVEID